MLRGPTGPTRPRQNLRATQEESATSEPNAIVEIRDLRKSFGAQAVLRGIDLRIAEGRITTIIGGSGSGKSVLIKHIIGLLRPDHGEVLFRGDNIYAMGAAQLTKVRRHFGMLFQGAALFDSMTVLENVAFPLREHSRLSNSEVRDVVRTRLEELNLFGIEHKYPAELSGGMKKRVALARAIVLEPEIIIYDEPTTGLDPIMIAQVDDMIARTQERHRITSIVISHDMASTFRISNYIAMIHEGRIVAEGSPLELKASDAPLVRQFIYVSGTGPLQRAEAA